MSVIVEPLTVQIDVVVLLYVGVAPEATVAEILNGADVIDLPLIAASDTPGLAAALTKRGVVADNNAPFPICPEVPLPQQYTVSEAVRAHVLFAPVEIAAILVIELATCAANCKFGVVVPFPSRPSVAKPQQKSVELAVSAHA
jgi:hypothetical protein